MNFLFENQLYKKGSRRCPFKLPEREIKDVQVEHDEKFTGENNGLPRRLPIRISGKFYKKGSRRCPFKLPEREIKDVQVEHDEKFTGENNGLPRRLPIRISGKFQQVFENSFPDSGWSASRPRQLVFLPESGHVFESGKAGASSQKEVLRWRLLLFRIGG